MKTQPAWNREELRQILIETKSFTKAGNHYNVSRERIRQVANGFFTRQELLNFGIHLDGRYPEGTTCLTCNRPIGPGKLTASNSRCVRCHMFLQNHGFERTDEYVYQVRVERALRSLPKRPRKSHCLRGHAMTEDNIYSTPKGYRRCRECLRFRHKRNMKNPDYRERQRQAVKRYQERQKAKG